jgi:hypothetical protein
VIVDTLRRCFSRGGRLGLPFFIANAAHPKPTITQAQPRCLQRRRYGPTRSAFRAALPVRDAPRVRPVLVLIMVVPVVAMAIALEHYICRGMLIGAVKG